MYLPYQFTTNDNENKNTTQYKYVYHTEFMVLQPNPIEHTKNDIKLYEVELQYQWSLAPQGKLRLITIIHAYKLCRYIYFVTVVIWFWFQLQ